MKYLLLLAVVAIASCAPVAPRDQRPDYNSVEGIHAENMRRLAFPGIL